VVRWPDEKLHDAVRAVPAGVTWDLDLDARPGRTRRTARLSAAAYRTALRPPHVRGGEHPAEPVPVTVVRVWEAAPPAGVAPLEWLLLTNLDAQIASKTRAVTLLSGESGARGNGFAARLRAFGERHIDGIWLDHLTLGADVSSVSISGSTMSPDSVPRYLRSLATDPALKGGQIDEFIIEKPVKGKSAAAGRLTFKAGHRGLVEKT